MGIIQNRNSLKKWDLGASDLYLRLKRLLSPKLMGSLFKVILAHNNKSKNFLGFK